jgi:uncharacterized membrane protein YfcA
VAAVPIAVPALFRNDMLPVQEAAVPLDVAAATLTALSCAVSELARPIGGRSWVLVVVLLVVLVCAQIAGAAVTSRVSANFRKNMFDLLLVMLGSTGFDTQQRTDTPGPPVSTHSQDLRS